MPVFRLNPEPYFPYPHLANAYGLLAVGGDLRPERLINAYATGVFPWNEEEQEILWWSPDPRLILELPEVKVTRSLRKTLRRGHFQCTADTAFARVLRGCAGKRAHDDGTWLTKAMQKAYLRLHRLGVAHSVETWEGTELVGGLYGVFLGRCFFGESMFSTRSDASKVALLALVDYLWSKGLTWIDCQVATDHLISLGAKEVARDAFLQQLEEGLKVLTSQALWQLPARDTARLAVSCPPGRSPEGRPWTPLFAPAPKAEADRVWLPEPPPEDESEDPTGETTKPS